VVGSVVVVRRHVMVCAVGSVYRVVRALSVIMLRGGG
jgi:hypothetical protein